MIPRRLERRFCRLLSFYRFDCILNRTHPYFLLLYHCSCLFRVGNRFLKQLANQSLNLEDMVSKEVAVEFGAGTNLLLRMFRKVPQISRICSLDVVESLLYLWTSELQRKSNKSRLFICS